MYVFRATSTERPLAAFLSEIRSQLASRAVEAPLQLLLAATGLECALADFWGRDEDSRSPRQLAALAVGLAAAEGYLHAGRGTALAAGDRSTVRQALECLAPFLPDSATPLPNPRPEGFRFYGLTPDAFLAPARRLARAARRPVLVVGLRTIGSTLAAVVAAAVRAAGVAVDLATLRPRGTPEDRHYAASAGLAAWVAAWPGLVAIVDEGPGLSGSSFGGAVRWLRSLGLSAARIVLLPSWNPSAARLSHTVVAGEWARWRKFPADPISPRPDAGADLSAGRWRRELAVAGAIPVWPQQERAKFLSPNRRWLFKFGGLGRFGREAADRARALAAAGFSPPAVYVGDGWLRSPRLTHQPLTARDAAAWATWVGRYLAFVRANFACGPRRPPAAELVLMARTNLERLFGPGEALPPPPEGVPIRLDGRMLRHEWAGRNGGFVKFDALDHGDDHFFPGPADIAWDLASLEYEFGPAWAAAARDEYARRSGDRQVSRRLPWYRLAYGLYRAAFSHFAQELVGSPDREWFRRQRDGYLRRVRSLLPPRRPWNSPTASATRPISASVSSGNIGSDSTSRAA